MAEKEIKRMIAETFLDVADALKTGSWGKKPVIGITALGSEHGEETIAAGAALAAKRGCRSLIIGREAGNHPLPEGVEFVKVETEEEAHKRMEELLDSKAIDGAVTMHYPFPIGVSTVGRAVTPGRGREMFLANTTGTSSTDRVCGMVRNAVYGVIAAKACGISRPTVGIANIDGARQTEKALLALKEKGYALDFAESERADGGLVMRGNDLLAGSADVMVMDPLTGNLMSKIFSSFSTGGSYEAVGYGYGPGIGEGYDRLIMIVSRASGAPVIAGAVEYATQLIQGKVFEVAKDEFAKANRAGLSALLDEIKNSGKKAEGSAEQVKMPPKEVVTAQIPGIEVMDLEDAVQCLWKAGIYAESGMGCTGPIVLMSPANKEKALQILQENDYVK